MKPVFVLIVFFLLHFGLSAQGCYNAFLKAGDELASSKTRQAYISAIKKWEEAKKEVSAGGCAPLTEAQNREVETRIANARTEIERLGRADDDHRFQEAKSKGITGLEEYLANCRLPMCRHKTEAELELNRLRLRQNEEALIQKARKATDPAEKMRLYEEYLQTPSYAQYRDEAQQEVKKLKDARLDNDMIEKARKSQKKKDFQDYVTGCPVCTFKREAELWLDDHKKKEEVMKADSIHWRVALKADNKDGYETYMRQHPTGNWTAKAEVRLRIIEQIEAYHPGLIYFKEGRYQMGNIEIKGTSLQNLKNEEAHEVCLRGFFIAECEMTFSIYSLYCEYMELTLPPDSGWGRGGQSPVIHVSWYDAVQFCNWLSRLKKTREYYKIEVQSDGQINVTIPDPVADGYRLPTEAEWEYAARSGGGESFFGTGEDEAASASINFCPPKDPKDPKKQLVKVGEQQYRKRTLPVKELKANKSGLYHMSGNVQEWCWDIYSDNYGRTSKVSGKCDDNPMGAATGAKRVVKGGSWRDSALECRSSARNKYSPDGAANMLGFRIAKNK
jgi:formylglycine-generating enzyme required for sulfatase activity